MTNISIFFLINENYGQIWVLLIFEMTRFKYQLKLINLLQKKIYQLKFITSQLFLFEQNLQINRKLLCTLFSYMNDRFH